MSNIICGFKYWLKDGIVTLAKSVKTGRFVSPRIVQKILDWWNNRQTKPVFTVYRFFCSFFMLFFVAMIFVATRHHVNIQDDESLIKQLFWYMVTCFGGMILTVNQDE